MDGARIFKKFFKIKKVLRLLKQKNTYFERFFHLRSLKKPYCVLKRHEFMTCGTYSDRSWTGDGFRIGFEKIFCVLIFSGVGKVGF